MWDATVTERMVPLSPHPPHRTNTISVSYQTTEGSCRPLCHPQQGGSAKLHCLWCASRLAAQPVPDKCACLGVGALIDMLMGSQNRTMIVIGHCVICV